MPGAHFGSRAGLGRLHTRARSLTRAIMASSGSARDLGPRVTKARRIQAELDKLYPPESIRPPLQSEGSFQHLCAVMLSAQTTDVKVNEVTPALFAKAPTPAAMAALDEKEIRDTIRQIGLAPTKAKRLRELSAMLVMRFGGEVPRELAELESLPGVGHKTASVVRSQCFGLPAMPVDTHIHRLAARWGLSDGRNVDQTERDLMQVFDEKDWNAIHLQIIFYGREHGKAGQSWPYPGPICSWAGLEDAPATTPAMKRKKRKQEHVGDDDAR